jgi:hypothetical protein
VIGGINTLKVVQFAAQNLKMDPTQSGGTIFKLITTAGPSCGTCKFNKGARRLMCNT